LSLDIALFYNNYDDLHALERRNDLIIPGDGYLLVPDLFVNAVRSQTYGFEVATNWQAMDWWRLQLAYSYLRMKFQNKPGYSELIPVFQEGSQPHHQISLRSSFDIRHDLEFDLWLYHVDEIPELIIGTLAHTASVDAYFSVNARLGWRPRKDLELSLTGTNLLGPPDLTEFSIEDLMQVKVVSAAKTEQALQDTAAAVFVITADDIRRSGVTQVMDALRLAPGVEVARIDSSRWAISIRGFNGRFANKLLVLIDGRTIYNAQFSGVYWELQDLFLPDIERIEVIRGPGGSLWGANAVNGVINIITKNAKDTPGGLVTLTAGDEERPSPACAMAASWAIAPNIGFLASSPNGMVW
jgi:outer membrane receptor for ferrienterochelin and colicin